MAIEGVIPLLADVYVGPVIRADVPIPDREKGSYAIFARPTVAIGPCCRKVVYQAEDLATLTGN